MLVVVGVVVVAIVLRPYSCSEVIHRAGDESFFPAFERERPRIVNNFAASAPSGYESSSISEKMNRTRLSNLVAAPKMISPTQIYSVNWSCAIVIDSKLGNLMIS